ncbi:MAG: T9SS type A sorting domain-containing protein [Bacteroidales bacterium]|jgi:hypothetical protein|nr:T9SS type A sorting domain-containing protein [Bacteroidales bacterium]
MKKFILLFVISFSTNLTFSQIKVNSLGWVGVGTLNPVEAFQIGDQFTFHNGGSKAIGYNFHWDNGPYRIKTGFTSAIQLSDDGGIYFSISDKGDEGSQIGWKYPFLINPISPENPNGSISFLGYGIEISQNTEGNAASIFPKTPRWGNCGTDSYPWGSVNTLYLISGEVYSDRLFYLQPQLIQPQNCLSNLVSEGSDILTKIKNLPCGYVSVDNSSNKNTSNTSDVQDNYRMVIDGSQISNIFPQLVKYDSSDQKYGIDYIGLIPYLITAIKEQQKTIDLLTENIAKSSYDPTNIFLKEGFINNEQSSSINLLYQNSPNPFNKHTTIEFFLAQGVNSASILFYNLQGTQIKRTVISERGKSNIIIKDSEFKPGMYYYSLLVDGIVVSIKRMIIQD